MKFVLIYFILFLMGCVSATPQVDRLLGSSSAFSSSYQIADVPFVAQKAGHCGPATLAMALQWHGKNISVEQLVSQVYTPGMQGSLQADLVSASRRQGMMAVPIEGFDALLLELNANHPVIIFENLALSWWPQWHYALVFGYDLSSQVVIMHSGPEAFKRWDLRKFERSWSLGDYWGLVIMPPDQLSASAGELAHVAAASGLEQVGRLEAADTAYRQILKRWPQSLVAQIGIANIAYTQKEYSRARDVLRQAKLTHPDSSVVWHNSVFAEAASGNLTAARQNALEAIRRAHPEVRASYLDSLREWLQ